MIDQLLVRFGRLAFGWKLLVGFVVLTLIASVFEAWGERHFFKAYFGEVLATFVHWGSFAAGVGLGAAASQPIYERTNKMWIAVIAFLVVLFSVMTTITLLGERIPGVKQRLEAMRNNDCHIEYDGRSSWTEC